MKKRITLLTQRKNFRQSQYKNRHIDEESDEGMDFSLLRNYLDKIDGNMVPSREMLVYKNHELVFKHFSANTDIYQSEKDKDLYYLFSASKVITCTAILQLCERGLLSLEAPVSRYLPEYAELYVEKEGNCKRAENKLTVKHLLTMTGGLNYNLQHPAIKEMQESTHGNGTTREVAAAIAKIPLVFEPGTNFKYSFCHDVLAAVIEVVSGMSFYDYLNENIFKPVGMKNVFFKPDNKILARMYNQYCIDPATQSAVLQKPSCPFRLTSNHESGGAGMIASAGEYALFIDALASGSTLSGKELLKPETVAMMTANCLTGKALETFKLLKKTGYGYGLGVRTMIDKKAGHSFSPIGEFGWDGAAGIFIFIDTENKISGIYAQHVLGCEYAFDYCHPAVRNLAYIGAGCDTKFC